MTTMSIHSRSQLRSPSVLSPCKEWKPPTLPCSGCMPPRSAQRVLDKKASHQCALMTGEVHSWRPPLYLPASSLHLPHGLLICPSGSRPAVRRPRSHVPSCTGSPQQPRLLAESTSPQEEGRRGPGLGPGSIYRFLKSIRDTDVGS